MSSKSHQTANARSRPPPELNIVFEIVQGSLDYSLRATTPHFRKRFSTSNAFWSSLSLRLTATCIHPPELAGRAPDFRLSTSDNIETAQWREDADRYFVLGNVDARKTSLKVWGMIPTAAVWPLSAAIQTGAVRYCILTTDPLFRGTTDIRGISFDGSPADPVDFIKEALE